MHNSAEQTLCAPWYMEGCTAARQHAGRQHGRARHWRSPQAFQLPGYWLVSCFQPQGSFVPAQSASPQCGGVSERAVDEPASSGNGAAQESASERYPERNPLVGGWAGGETGLRQWIEARQLAAAAVPSLHLAAPAQPCRLCKWALSAWPGQASACLQAHEARRSLGRDCIPARLMHGHPAQAALAIRQPTHA